jgi:hypothetical protein
VTAKKKLKFGEEIIFKIRLKKWEEKLVRFVNINLQECVRCNLIPGSS